MSLPNKKFYINASLLIRTTSLWISLLTMLSNSCVKSAATISDNRFQPEFIALLKALVQMGKRL